MLLPRTSLTKEAMLQDDELMDQLMAGREQDERGPGSGPLLSEWSPEVEYLARITDRLSDVVNATVAAAGGKPKRTPPARRPSTAVDRHRLRTREREHLSLVRRLLPNGPQELPPAAGDGP